MSGSVSERSLDFEITRRDCIIGVSKIWLDEWQIV